MADPGLLVRKSQISGQSVTTSYDMVFPDDLDLEITRMPYTYVNLHDIQVGVCMYMYMSMCVYMYILLLGTCLAPHTIVSAQGLSESMKILSAAMWT